MNTNLAYKEEYVKEELINGQVVLMSPQPSINHVNVINNISILFGNFLKEIGRASCRERVWLYV